MRNRESGLTLVELLVSLVITSLLATAIFSFFLNIGQSVSHQSANGEMWQRGRNAMAIMRQAIESAGYGLPSYNQCPNGVVGNSGGSAVAMVAITALVQSTGYVPSSTSTYSFSTVIGGGTFGDAPATIVTGTRASGHSENIPVATTRALKLCDYALFVPSGGGGACLMGQITNIPHNAVGLNSGASCGASLNPNQIFLTPLHGTNGTTATIGTGASLYDLGYQHFLFERFQIMENPAGGTPTLYMTQYTGLPSQSATPTPQALASGVVDIQMQYGLGSDGSVQNWVAPVNYSPGSGESIVAVKLAMLIRSTRYLPNSVSPSSFNLLGHTYTVPVTGGPGCMQGNCRHYEYHLFQSIIPVRNGIWGGE